MWMRAGSVASQDEDFINTEAQGKVAPEVVQEKYGLANR
jgi:hypothetical protein